MSSEASTIRQRGIRVRVMAFLRRRLRGGWGFVAPTPLGQDWGWGSRLVEIGSMPIAIPFWGLVLTRNACDWLLTRFMGER